ncbi:hypothetical protein NIES4071_51300 [Calothrix sp. NIES-4071]|nr:hypothetical protein NIES4071_51300 [Calothrix sp. NIES-4071]BAZ59438.1 hypothetical protein NIES4105_51250 [Calothrix sp. NIES-4105]
MLQCYKYNKLQCNQQLDTISERSKFLRVYHLLIGLILLALSPFILKSVFKRPSSDNNVQPRPTQSSLTPSVTATPASAVITQPSQPPGNIWKSVLRTTMAPVGWDVAPCKGDEPFLCVSSNGKTLGSVEMEIFPLSQQPKFLNMLITAGIPKGVKIDYQNPSYQDKIRQALDTWVTDEYAVLTKERLNSYAGKVNFSGYPPQKANIGKLQGVRYGFTGLKREGGVQEQHLKYVAFDGNSLYVINTAYDLTSKSGKFDKYENLAVFEPFLSEITSKLNLPQ